MMNNDEGTLQYLALMWLKMVNKKDQPGPKRGSWLNKQSIWFIIASVARSLQLKVSCFPTSATLLLA